MFTFQLIAFMAVAFGLAGYALLKDKTEHPENNDEKLEVPYSDDPRELLMRLQASIARRESQIEQRERAAASR